MSTEDQETSVILFQPPTYKKPTKETNTPRIFFHLTDRSALAKGRKHINVNSTRKKRNMKIVYARTCEKGGDQISNREIHQGHGRVFLH